MVDKFRKYIQGWQTMRCDRCEEKKKHATNKSQIGLDFHLSKYQVDTNGKAHREHSKGRLSEGTIEPTSLKPNGRLDWVDAPMIVGFLYQQ